MSKSDEISPKKRRAIRNAIAHQEIEGMNVPPEVVEMLERVARGEIGVGEGVETLLQRYQDVSEVREY